MVAWIKDSPSETIGYFGFGRLSGNIAYNGLYWWRMFPGMYAQGRAQIAAGYVIDAINGQSGWHFYATTRALDGVVRIYRDGVFMVSNPSSTQYNYYGGNMVGFNQETGDKYSSLTIDQLRIYNRVLTDKEIYAMYAEGF